MSHKPANRILAALLSEQGRAMPDLTNVDWNGNHDAKAQAHVEATDHTELHRHDDDGGPGCPNDRRAAQEEARKLTVGRIEFAAPYGEPPRSSQPKVDVIDFVASLGGAVPDVVQKSDHGSHLPTDAKARKALPIATGVLDYFPDALAAVAEVSRIGNDQHNPGQPLHWSKGKSTDHADCAIRHFAERYEVDTDGGLHGAKAAWRMLADLQISIEAKRAGMTYADYIAHLKAQEAA